MEADAEPAVLRSMEDKENVAAGKGCVSGGVSRGDAGGCAQAHSRLASCLNANLGRRMLLRLAPPSSDSVSAGRIRAGGLLSNGSFCLTLTGSPPAGPQLRPFSHAERAS